MGVPKYDWNHSSTEEMEQLRVRLQEIDSRNANGSVTSSTFHPSGDATGATDYANLQALITATPTGGEIVVAPDPSTGAPIVINNPLVISKALTLRGTGMTPLYGSQALGADSWNMPLQTPYLTGSVIKQVGTGKDIIQITGAAGIAVNLHDLGLIFGTPFANTGNGVYSLPTTPSHNPLGGTYDNGLLGATWDNVMVWGHDGSHYAFNITNPILCRFNGLQSFGGGGLNLDSNPQFYGNCTFDALYVMLVDAGTAHGIQIGASNKSVNYCHFTRPQVVMVDATAELPATTAPTSGQLLVNGVSSSLCVMDSPDLEASISGAAAHMGAIGVSGSPFFQGVTVTYANNSPVPVALPGMAVTVGTGTPSQINLINNATSKAYGFITSGTADAFYLAGTLGQTGGVTAATAAAGAQAGSTPPAPVITGTALRGTVTFGTGGSATAGAMAVISHSLGDPFSNLNVVVTATNAATAALNLYVNAPSSKTAFTVSCQGTPSSSQANTVYAFNYHILT